MWTGCSQRKFQMGLTRSSWATFHARWLTLKCKCWLAHLVNSRSSTSTNAVWCIVSNTSHDDGTNVHAPNRRHSRWSMTGKPGCPKVQSRTAEHERTEWKTVDQRIGTVKYAWYFCQPKQLIFSHQTGYAFLCYKDPSVTDLACAGLNGQEIGGKRIACKPANQKSGKHKELLLYCPETKMRQLMLRVLSGFCIGVSNLAWVNSGVFIFLEHLPSTFSSIFLQILWATLWRRIPWQHWAV